MLINIVQYITHTFSRSFLQHQSKILTATHCYFSATIIVLIFVLLVLIEIFHLVLLLVF